MKKFFSVFKAVLSIAILLVIGKFGFDMYQEYQTEKEAAENVIKVACVGDSNTYRHGGTAVKEYKYSYHLSNLLGDGYEVKNFGEVGACVNPNGNLPYTKLRVFNEGVEYEADVLIVMLGTNDVWEHNWVSEVSFKEEYLKLIDSYLETEHVPEVYLCTLPKLYQEDDLAQELGNKERVELLSTIIREVAVERGYHLIDINQVTDNHRDWYEGDLLHLNKDGAKGVAEAIVDVLNEK